MSLDFTPNGWRKSTLAQCCDIVAGGTPSRERSDYWGGEIPWVTPKDISNLDDPLFLDPPEHISELGLRNSSATILPEGAILLSSRAPIGLVAIAGKPMATNQGFKSLVPGPELDSRFLYHAIKRMVPAIAARGNGATFKEVSKAVMAEIEISYPSTVTEQQRIAAILDKADSIRRKRRQALAEIDALLRATFLDMFGDPAINPKEFDVAPVQRVLSRDRAGTQSGPFGAALKKHEYVSEGIPVWGIENVENNNFNPNMRLFVTAEKFAELDRYDVRDGDVLISRAGTVGRMCIARPPVEKSVLSTNLVRVSLDRRKMLPEYFVTLFTSFPDRVSRLRANKKDNAFSFLNPETLKVLEIPQPGIDLQTEFAKRVRAIATTKQLRVQAIEMGDDLFGSLSQCAFRGEL